MVITDVSDDNSGDLNSDSSQQEINALAENGFVKNKIVAVLMVTAAITNSNYQQPTKIR